MKKLLGLAAGTVLALVWATDVSAVCGNNLTFGQSTGNCGGGYCYVVTPNAAVPSGGSFWGLGTGNPTTGVGDDNGTQAVDTWCRPATPGCYLVGGWNASGLEGVDGCIEGKIPAGKTAEVMVVAFSHSAAGQGYYAAASSYRNFGGAEFEFANSGSNITLQPIPAPAITGTQRQAPNVQITVGSPNLAGAFTADGSATADEVIKSYRVYKQVLARGSAAPTSRDKAGWVAAGGATALGTPFTYTETDCATDRDIYLATAVVYDSGFESSVVSANANRVQCGPTLAEPNPRFKLIDKKPTSKDLNPRQ